MQRRERHKPLNRMEDVVVTILLVMHALKTRDGILV